MKPALHTAINRGHPLADKLVGCYLFNEAGGQIIHDLANNQHGVMTNMSPADWMEQPGDVCLDFNSTTNFIQCPDFAGFNFISNNKPFSLAIEFIADSDQGIYVRLIQKRETAAPVGWQIIKAHTNHRFEFDRQNAVDHKKIGYIPEPTPGKKYQWIFVYNPVSDAVAIYENGVLKGTNINAASTFAFAASNNFSIGSRGGEASTNFDGKIFYCFLWERLLSAAEAFDLYLNPYAMLTKRKRIFTNIPSAPPAPQPNAVLFGCNF